jgi:hypothetical protein
MAMATKTIEQIREMGHTGARAQCWDSGDSGTPDGGWHALLIQRVGVYGVCNMLGGDAAVERHGWSDEMRAKFAAYDEGALQGAAEYLQAIADADAGTGADWTDSKNPAESS